ncbi:MAG: hypothetical protein ABEK17_00575 [Candidatus Aenigmatarchaeota archaeon]
MIDYSDIYGDDDGEDSDSWKELYKSQEDIDGYPGSLGTIGNYEDFDLSDLLGDGEKRLKDIDTNTNHDFTYEEDLNNGNPGKIHLPQGTHVFSDGEVTVVQLPIREAYIP